MDWGQHVAGDPFRRIDVPYVGSSAHCLKGVFRWHRYGLVDVRQVIHSWDPFLQIF